MAQASWQCRPFAVGTCARPRTRVPGAAPSQGPARAVAQPVGRLPGAGPGGLGVARAHPLLWTLPRSYCRPGTRARPSPRGSRLQAQRRDCCSLLIDDLRAIKGVIFISYLHPLAPPPAGAERAPRQLAQRPAKPQALPRARDAQGRPRGCRAGGVETPEAVLGPGFTSSNLSYI